MLSHDLFLHTSSANSIASRHVLFKLLTQRLNWNPAIVGILLNSMSQMLIWLKKRRRKPKISVKKNFSCLAVSCIYCVLKCWGDRQAHHRGHNHISGLQCYIHSNHTLLSDDLNLLFPFSPTSLSLPLSLLLFIFQASWILSSASNIHSTRAQHTLTHAQGYTHTFTLTRPHLRSHALERTRTHIYVERCTHSHGARERTSSNQAAMKV